MIVIRSEQQPLTEPSFDSHSHLTENEVFMAVAHAPRRPDLAERLRIEVHTFGCRECWRKVHPALCMPVTDDEYKAWAEAEAHAESLFPDEHPPLIQVYAFQDGTLSDPAKLAEVRDHVEDCFSCKLLLLEREDKLG